MEVNFQVKTPESYQPLISQDLLRKYAEYDALRHPRTYTVEEELAALEEAEDADMLLGKRMSRNELSRLKEYLDKVLIELECVNFKKPLYALFVFLNKEKLFEFYHLSFLFSIRFTKVSIFENDIYNINSENRFPTKC